MTKLGSTPTPISNYLEFCGYPGLSTVDTAQGTAQPRHALPRHPSIRRSSPMKGALAWLIGIPIPIIIILYLLDVF